MTDHGLLLWSMKLRQNCSGNVAKVASKIHEIAQLVGLQEGNYWAVVVNCQPESEIDVGPIPEGTLYLPAECTKALLSPFGASYLLLDVWRNAGIDVAE
eukprot:m.66648 g.66648  ORF g.66648 m.66648 type:complete len:99 (-) comp7631_c0_seq1:55-351(-)